MASKFITICSASVRKSAITCFYTKPSSEVEGVSPSDAMKCPYALVVRVIDGTFVSTYDCEKERDMAFDILTKSLEEE